MKSFNDYDSIEKLSKDLFKWFDQQDKMIDLWGDVEPFTIKSEEDNIIFEDEAYIGKISIKEDKIEYYDENDKRNLRAKIYREQVAS